ncbi:hypothetical protein BJV78DRAFT_1269563 [Lactifluus subvellereus]|nr:hypothetical protein BJV78DRAFT_1269563 [Lactifluus subvellereus]
MAMSLSPSVPPYRAYAPKPPGRRRLPRWALPYASIPAPLTRTCWSSSWRISNTPSFARVYDNCVCLAMTSWWRGWDGTTKVAMGIVNLPVQTMYASDKFAMVVLGVYAPGVPEVRSQRVWKL